MKYSLYLILLFSKIAISQTQGLQCGKITITRNLAATNAKISTVQSIDGTIEIIEVKTGTSEGEGILLMSVVNRFFFWFNASPALGNFSQEASTGSWLISLPNTPTTNKSIFIPDKGIAIVYNSTTNGIDFNTQNPFPIEIRAIIQGQPTGNIKCTIGSDGNVVWNNISVRTASAIGTTGLVQYTIN